MDREVILATLRKHAPELRAAGLIHLRIFGSVARGDASPQSDIDLLADFEESRPVTLVTMGSLQSRLADLLGAKVDLSSTDWMRDSVRNQALEEALLAF